MNIIIDYRASKETFDALKQMKFNIVKTPKHKFVYDAISGHPDIMVHKIGDNELITEPSVYEYFKLKLPEHTVGIGETFLNDKYPGNIAYNVCALSNKIFCNIPNTDRKIFKRYEQMGYEIINVKQGYAKCSICVVSDNAIITADKGIAKAAIQNRIDVLEITNGDVRLDGFEYGFFGGATGLVADNMLAVNGNIERHTDAKRIVDFCANYGVNVISLNNGYIYDIGSIISV